MKKLLLGIAAALSMTACNENKQQQQTADIDTASVVNDLMMSRRSIRDVYKRQSLYNVWKYLFKVIVISNQSLSIIDSHQTLLSAEQTRDFTAEVRAVRALFYYYAMDMFGRVPIVTSYDVKLEQVTQSERSEVFKFIVDELQDVAPQLADEHSNKEGNYYGRVTRPVANFLLAKLCLLYTSQVRNSCCLRQ